MTTTAELKIQEFLDALAANQSTPGGGGASALTGAQAAALVSMVINFTLGKKKYAAVEEEMTELIRKTEDLRARLTKLADKDVQAFGAVVAGYGMPRESADEKAARTAAIQAGLREAMEVSMQIAEAALEVLRTTVPAGARGNSNVVSDAATGAHLALASVQGALINVKINLKFINDRDYVQTWTERAESLAKTADSLFQKAKATCSQTLGIEV